MTKSQQVRYRTILWPAACKGQSWNLKDDAKRREITIQTTGQDTTIGLTNKQVDRLFRRLEWLADPTNFDTAFADANPELADEAAHRNRIIHRIEDEARVRSLSAEYLTDISEGKCRVHKAKTWRDLPTDELLHFSMTVCSRGTAPGKAFASPVQDKCTADAGPSFMQRTRARLAEKSAQPHAKPPVLVG